MRNAHRTPPVAGHNLWDASENGKRLHSFLRELQCFLQLTGLEKSCWGIAAAHFLKGAALDIWELELELLLYDGVDAITWDKFVSCMTEHFASLMPAREARAKYDRLTQTGSVANFLTEFRLCIRELTGTPFYPSGNAIIDVMTKFKAEVRTYVQDNVPDGWYTDVSQIYAKALNWEYNRQAAVQVDQRDRQTSTFQADASARQPRHNANAHNANRRNRQRRGFANAGRTTPSTVRPEHPREQGPAAKRRKVSHDTEVAKEERDARRAAGKCPCCGLAGHVYKKDNKLVCPNLRNAAPHATISTAKPNSNFNKQA